jgi:hypothetical protein
MFMYVVVTRQGKYGKVDHSEGMGGERVMAILRFHDGSPRLCQLRTVSFWPRWQALICNDRKLGLCGPVNLVAH